MSVPKEGTPPDVQTLLKRWWETTGLDAKDSSRWDAEVKAVNAIMPPLAGVPAWALEVRGAMPRYGFEMCSHRWLDGLDHLLGMLESEAFRPSQAGHCGDVPGRIGHAAERRAAAVERWLKGQPPGDDAVARRTAERLGSRTKEKDEAAACFVEMVRGGFFGPWDKAAREARTARWKARAASNPTLRAMFEGEGFHELLNNDCGFKVIDRLDVYIEMIGGDNSRVGERHGVCNTQLRFVLRDDPARYDVTRGYLWGLDARLRGRDGAWLRANKPECSGSAIYAHRKVSAPGELTPLRRWLAASCLKATKLWCQCALKHMGKDGVPARARDLPDVAAALRA